MNFLKYLLRCILSGISLIDGSGDLVSGKEWVIGCLEIIIIGILFCIFAFKIFKNTKHPVLYSILVLIAIFIVFAILCIIIEFIIKDNINSM